MSKYYEIPCAWEVYGTVEVSADSLEEAIEKVEADIDWDAIKNIVGDIEDE